jgi:hypothetical protein
MGSQQRNGQAACLSESAEQREWGYPGLGGFVAASSKAPRAARKDLLKGFKVAQEKKAAPDWERIEADYRAGLLSVREIAAAHGVSHTAIQKRANKEPKWERDLGKRVQAKADALVAKREVASQVATEKAATDAAIVDANAQVIANIRLAHRSDIARSRKLAMSLLEELEIETGDLDLFRELGEILRSDDDKGQDRRNDLYNKVISSAGRIDSMKKLSETMKTLVGLEREAYGLVEAQKVELTGKNGGPIETRRAQEMTDDELAAFLTAGGARAMDSPQS